MRKRLERYVQWNSQQNYSSFHKYYDLACCRTSTIAWCQYMCIFLPVRLRHLQRRGRWLALDVISGTAEGIAEWCKSGAEEGVMGKASKFGCWKGTIPGPLMDSYTGSQMKLQCNHFVGNITTGQMSFAQSNQNLPISDQTAWRIPGHKLKSRMMLATSHWVQSKGDLCHTTQIVARFLTLQSLAMHQRSCTEGDLLGHPTTCWAQTFWSSLPQHPTQSGSNAMMPMSPAHAQLIKQVHCLFQAYPHQKSVVLVAITGFWWWYMHDLSSWPH